MKLAILTMLALWLCACDPLPANPPTGPDGDPPTPAMQARPDLDGNGAETGWTEIRPIPYGGLFRIKVHGGWLYMLHDYQKSGLAFVPDPTRYAP